MRVELLAYTRDADRICASAGNSCYSEHPSYEIMEDIETCSLRLKANVNPDLALELLLLNMKEK